MNRYIAKDDAFEHYVNDELRAVVPWESRDIYAGDWPDAPEFVFAPDIAAPAPAEAVAIDRPTTEEQPQ